MVTIPCMSKLMLQLCNQHYGRCKYCPYVLIITLLKVIIHRLIHSGSVQRVTSKEVVGHYRASFVLSENVNTAPPRRLLNAIVQRMIDTSPKRRRLNVIGQQIIDTSPTRGLLNVTVHRLVMPGNVYWASSKVLA